LDALASRRPSGDQATQRMASSCPVTAASTAAVSASQIRRVRAMDAETMRCPSGSIQRVSAFRDTRWQVHVKRSAQELPLAVITASVLVLGHFAVLQPRGGQLAGACRPPGRAGGGKNGRSPAAKWLKPREGGSAGL
jgi:hypothetical protein